MELRDIEIFLALADELHFGRTAERLHISQARVSQSIAKQERRIGTALFERSSRRVALTPIGAELHAELKAAYERILSATAKATAAARGTSGTLTLGLIGPQAHDFAALISRFRDRHPAVDLRFQEVHFSDPFGPLRRGDVDMSVAWLPVREPDLAVGPPLRTEPLWLIMAEDHPLARKERVGLEDLGDHQVPRSAHPLPTYWEDALIPFRTPAGRPIERGAKVATFQELLAVVASGGMVSLVTGEAIRFYQRPGIVFREVRDRPVATWALLWRAAGETSLIRALADVAGEFQGDVPIGAG